MNNQAIPDGYGKLSSGVNNLRRITNVPYIELCLVLRSKILGSMGSSIIQIF